MHLLYRHTELLQREHKSHDAEKMRDQSIALNRQLSDIADILEDRIKAAQADEKKNAHRLEIRDECQHLILKNEKIDRWVENDVIICLTKEAKPSFDPIKVATFCVGFPVTANSLAKAYWGEKSPAVGIVAALSIVVGAIIAFQKQIKEGWHMASAQVCDTSQHIKEKCNFYSFYLKETTHRNALVAAMAFGIEAISLTQRIPKVSAKRYKQASLPKVPQKRLGL